MVNRKAVNQLEEQREEEGKGEWGEEAAMRRFMLFESVAIVGQTHV